MVTVIRGAVFNAYVKVLICLVLTVGMGWVTVWYSGTLTETLDAPEYENQNWDLVESFIAMVVCGLVKIALFVVTILVIVWWIKASRQRAQSGP